MLIHKAKAKIKEKLCEITTSERVVNRNTHPNTYPSKCHFCHTEPSDGYYFYKDKKQNQYNCVGVCIEHGKRREEDIHFWANRRNYSPVYMFDSEEHIQNLKKYDQININ
jgi:hypothetical protein